MILQDKDLLMGGYGIDRNRPFLLKFDGFEGAMYSSLTTNQRRWKKVKPSDESILVTHPQLAAEWSEKNEITPDDVTAGAHDRVWWKGKCGHEWQAVVNNRTHGTGCPYCTTRATLTGFNDLATLRPDLAAEWNYEKNGELKPELLRPGSNKKVWWKCKNGHEWQASLNSRSSGNGCRICSNKLCLKGFNDLATKRPDLAAEWSDKNLPITPDSIIWKKHKRFWWKCRRCGNEYIAWLTRRIELGTGCPFCSGYKIKEGYNDITTTDPDIAKDWDYDANGALVPGSFFRRSLRSVKWKCANGHSYAMSIYDRTVNGKGCVICDVTFRASFSELLILHLAKREGISYELGSDISELYLPELKLAFEAEGVSQEKQKAQKKKKKELKKQGINLTILPRAADLQKDASKLIKLLNQYGSNIKTDIKEDIEVLKKDFYGEDYRAIPYDGGGDFKDVLGANIRYLNVKNTVPLNEAFPELCSEWSEKNFPFKPEDEDARSGGKVWWKCGKCGSEWKGIVSNRTSGRRSGCHVCAGKRIEIGINDLRTTHPMLCEEWSSRNKNIVPEQFTHGSTARVWWRCKNGHEWESQISNRTMRGNGCPICARMPLEKGVNDLKTMHPEVLDQWSDRNGDLRPEDIRASHRKQVWWKCRICGNEFLAQPHSVINRKGCKRCQSTIGRYWKGILTEEEYIKEEYR